MKRITSLCAIFTALCGTVDFGAPAHAEILIFQASVSLGDNIVVGKCNFRIGQSDPYDVIDGPCVTSRDGTPFMNALNPRPFPPAPRDKILQVYYTSVFQLHTPIAGSNYCQRFGGNDANRSILFAHQGSGPPLVKEGNVNCKSAEAQVKAYWQEFCVGSFVWVYNEYSLIPGVHLSFRRISQPLLCFAAAVYGGPL